MHCSHFVVEDNPNKIFSTDDVKVSFRKEPAVGRVWTMSYEQLADLKEVIATFLAAKQLG